MNSTEQRVVVICLVIEAANVVVLGSAIIHVVTVLAIAYVLLRVIVRLVSRSRQQV